MSASKLPQLGAIATTPLIMQSSVLLGIGVLAFSSSLIIYSYIKNHDES